MQNFEGILKDTVGVCSGKATRRWNGLAPAGSMCFQPKAGGVSGLLCHSIRRCGGCLEHLNQRKKQSSFASALFRSSPHGSWRWKSGLSMTCENLTPCTPYRTRYYINDRIGLRAQHAVLASRFGLEFLSSAKQQQQKHDIHHHDEAFKANLGLVSPQSQSIHHGSPSTSGDGGGQGIVCARNSGRLRTRRFLCVGSCPNP